MIGEANRIRKVIFDTDPGIDDAMALLYLSSIPRVELLGITTVPGNASIETCTRNALILCELFSIDTRVYPGDDTGLTGNLPDDYPDFVHGIDGLGELNLADPAASPEPVNAWDFLTDSVRRAPNEITLLAVGRLTNLARAIQSDPTFAANVKEVIFMGGTVATEGNVTPFAEANIIGDPEAASVLFDSGIPLTMVGLDVTNRTRMSIAYLEELFSFEPPFRETVLRMNRFYAGFYRDTEKTSDFPVHDSSAVACLDDPGLFSMVQGKLSCVLTGDQRGRTLIDEMTGGIHRVCSGVKSNILLERYATSVTERFC